MTMGILASGSTDVGRVRRSNEDSYGVYPELHLYVVADGMGGHVAGEVASRLAVEAIRSSVATGLKKGSTTPPDQRLVQAIQQANEHIIQTSKDDPRLIGMGTTVVGALTDQNTAYIGHVGDSRAYLLRNKEIKQLTKDHSLLNEYLQKGLIAPENLADYPYKHIITRALGSHPVVEVDLQAIDLQPNDSFLLCTDGLTNMLSEKDIHAVLMTMDNDPEKGCHRLIEVANSKGGEDNITAVIFQWNP
jgi:serine/threonine protein phosphatase PrpC